MSAVTRELVAQLLDQHRLRLHLGEQKRREPPQFLGVFGQRFGHVQHGQSYQSKGKTGIPDMLSRPVYPALRGVQLRCGRRQSIPSSSIASCAGVRAILPSFADGHTNRPFSRRSARTGMHPGHPTR